MRIEITFSITLDKKGLIPVFFSHFSVKTWLLNQRYYSIDDLQEIGKSPVVKHRFTMCCRMGTIACR